MSPLEHHIRLVVMAERVRALAAELLMLHDAGPDTGRRRLYAAVCTLTRAGDQLHKAPADAVVVRSPAPSADVCTPRPVTVDASKAKETDLERVLRLSLERIRKPKPESPGGLYMEGTVTND